VQVKGLILAPLGAAPESAWTSPSLQPVANRPIVCHVLDGMRRIGITDVVVAVAASECEEFAARVSSDRPAGVEVEYLSFAEDEPEGALSAAGEIVGDAACVVHVANGLLEQPLGPLVGQMREEAPDLIALVHQLSGSRRSIGLATRRLLRSAGGPPEDGLLDLTGICLLGPGALRQAHGMRWRQSGELDLVALAERLAGTGRFAVERVRGWHCYAGDAVDLLELNRLALDGLRSAVDGVDDGEANGAGASSALEQESRVEGPVAVHPSASVQASVIVGPAIVGPGAVVLESYIGPYTSIGADVRIESAEVERSIIMPGASITHIGGRLVGSVVGRDARIFRDFSLPRALRVNVGDGGEVALC
jgi:glucose-1-phosphate thymidylyltransferase